MDLIKTIRRADIVLLILLLLSALFVFMLGLKDISGAEKGEPYVNITRNGKPYKTLSLDDDATIDMGSNTIVISDGAVYMKEADCKNQLCVNTGKISEPGQSIICLPNRIAVEIVNGEEGYDAVIR